MIHPAAEAEAVSLLQADQFRAWLGSRRSDLILLDGSGAGLEFTVQPERLSAKSVLCASLLASLGRAEPESFQLFFFCGLHASNTDSFNEGPRGMMRSLLCDLAKEAQRRGWLNLDFVYDKEYRDGIEEKKIEYLCDAFYRILLHLKVNGAVDFSIYCIIDGMAFYEKPMLLNDLRVVLEIFQKIIQDTSLIPAFKLLMTGPHRVQHIHSILDLPPNKRLRRLVRFLGRDKYSMSRDVKEFSKEDRGTICLVFIVPEMTMSKQASI